MAKKAVELKFHAPDAKHVSLAGTFNNWDTSSNLAKKDRQGDWVVKVSLTQGKYEYKFFVDGSWLTDYKCLQTVPNGLGTTNSVLVVK